MYKSLARNSQVVLPMRRMSSLCTVLLAALAAALPAAAADDPWGTLSKLRTRLELASPVVADFEQTFVAVGFSSGETETGRLSLDLPACLRWDYDGEFPKSFLVCGHVVYAWNDGEESGRRQFIAQSDEQGLELLRLDVDQLRRRYTAVAGDSRDGRISIVLRPKGASDDSENAEDAIDAASLDPAAPIRDATIWLSEEGFRLMGLSYHDLEGNRTDFSFATYRDLGNRAAFDPPAGIEWLD